MLVDTLSTKYASKVAPLIFVADNSVAVREAIGGLLASMKMAVQLFASTCDLLGPLENARTCTHDRPNCLILDVRMLGMCGPEVTERLVRASRNIPIIFLSDICDTTAGVQKMRAGMRDFLSKPFRDGEILQSVRSALAYDRTYRTMQESQKVLRIRYESLTAREQTILSLMNTGLPNKRIACELGLSEIAVRVHRGRLMRKMKASSLVELVTMEASVREIGDEPHF